MANYRISGVWTDGKGTITHYAMHLLTDKVLGKSEKMLKQDAVKLLDNAFNQAMTMMWDYKSCLWKNGEKVEVIDHSFLRSYPDNKVSDNLQHLINYAWL